MKVSGRSANPDPLVSPICRNLGVQPFSFDLKREVTGIEKGCVMKFLSSKESTQTDNGEPLVTGIVEIVMLIPGRQAARV